MTNDPALQRLQDHCDTLNRSTASQAAGWFWYVAGQVPNRFVARRDSKTPA